MPLPRMGSAMKYYIKTRVVFKSIQIIPLKLKISDDAVPNKVDRPFGFLKFCPFLDIVAVEVMSNNICMLRQKFLKSSRRYCRKGTILNYFFLYRKKGLDMLVAVISYIENVLSFLFVQKTAQNDTRQGG